MSAWNSYQTNEGTTITAGIITFKGGNGDEIHSYLARPTGGGPYPGVVLIHHLPGWDESYQEFARRFANHGYTAICPDLYCRVGHGTPDDVAARVRAQGGVPDEQVVGDATAAMRHLRSLPISNGKVGIIGSC